MKKRNDWYVSMTDTSLSGWGGAKNKINKLIIKCDSCEEAEIVEDNAQHRTDMRYINIRTEKPYYSTSRYLVQYKTKLDGYKAWFIKDSFKNKKG